MKKMRKMSALLVALAIMATFAVPALAVPATNEVDDIVFYDSFENRTDLESVGKHAAASGHGWYSGGNASKYGKYAMLNGELVTSLDCPESFDLPINWAYTLKDGDAFTGKIALETKVMSTVDETFEIRILNRNLTQEGGTTYSSGDSVTTNAMIYGVLGFNSGEFSYSNVISAPKEEGGYVNTVEYAPSIAIVHNEWVTLRYEIDTDAETYTVYANGTMLFEDAPMYINKVADADRTFTQKVTNIAFMTVRRDANKEFGVKLDDIAVYDLDSTTKYYWSDVTVPECSCYVDDVIYDKKIEIPLVDSNGATTDKIVKTPVRLGRLDSSKPGIQLTTVDGIPGNIKFTVNKEVVISQGDVWEEKDFTPWINNTGNAKTETENGNNYLRMTANGSTAYTMPFNDTVRFASAKNLEISFKIRFINAGGMTGAGDSFVMQFLDNNNGGLEMPALYFLPGVSMARYVKSQTADAYGASLKYITNIPGIGNATNTDTAWHEFKFVYENNTLKIYVDGKQGQFNDHNTANGTAHLTEAPVPANFGLTRICFKYNNASQTTAVIDVDDFKVEVPTIRGNATLESIGEQEWTTAKNVITLPTAVIGTLSDGSKAYYDITSLTAVGNEAITVGEYTYNATVVDQESPVTVKVKVLENAYTLSTPTKVETGVEAAITNNVSHEAPGKLLVAIYRGGSLVNVEQKVISDTDSYTTEFEVESGDAVKAFVWNVNGIAPLAVSTDDIMAD